ncbi:MAG: hypothetical protein A2169_00470 [Deltaproteobacteria bacterium RBG_13_47_9]|nr:MAG: hypothetical protein A2169_00470 [Deltaproteobacteria bacterium RBG_13_47_9]
MFVLGGGSSGHCDHLLIGRNRLDGLQDGSGDIQKVLVQRHPPAGLIQKAASGGGIHPTNIIRRDDGIIIHGTRGIALGDTLTHQLYLHQLHLLENRVHLSFSQWIGKNVLH